MKIIQTNIFKIIFDNWFDPSPEDGLFGVGPGGDGVGPGGDGVGPGGDGIGPGDGLSSLYFPPG